MVPPSSLALFICTVISAAADTSVPIDIFISNKTNPAVNESASTSTPEIILSEKEQCGEIIDMHLHLAQWFTTVDELLVELDTAQIDRGILYAVYAPINFPGEPDQNEQVSTMALASSGRIVGFASCNTTHPDWDAMRDVELERLTTYLEKPEFVAAKLAPPHTCLEMNSERMRDVVHTISDSSKPILAIHVGTTPFCSSFMGGIVGFTACCGYEYVSPSILGDTVKDYSNVTFILLHSGHDFLPPGDENYYNGSLVDESIELAKTYSNVYLEISALHSENNPQEEGDFRYPGGLQTIQKIVGADLADKIIWGSDGNHFKGNLIHIMKESFEDMIEAGMTDSERCEAIAGTSRRMFFSTSDTGENDGAGGEEEVDGGDGDESDTAPAPASSARSHFCWLNVIVIQFCLVVFTFVATVNLF